MSSTEENILRQFSKFKNIDELMDKYSKKELNTIYYMIYGRKPLSSSTKLDIIKLLRNRAHTIERAKAFAELTCKI